MKKIKNRMMKEECEHKKTKVTKPDGWWKEHCVDCGELVHVVSPYGLDQFRQGFPDSSESHPWGRH